MKRISVEDENESALLFQLLGTIVDAGQEKVAAYIPGTVSNIANTITNLLPSVPDPWPQVILLYSFLRFPWSILSCFLQTIQAQ